MKILLVAIFIFGLFGTIRSFIKSNLRFRRSKKWFKFSNQILEYSKEIVDPNIRMEFLEWHLDNIIGVKNIDDVEDKYNDIVRLENELITRFGDHIPGLKSKITSDKRESKLKELFK